MWTMFGEACKSKEVMEDEVHIEVEVIRGWAAG
jgi:hypothetical protein